MDPEILRQNDVSRAALREFAEQLDDADFDRLVGELSVRSWLCHLAFWDRVICFRIESLQRSGVLPSGIEGSTLDSINEGCELLASGIPGRVAARLAVESADAADDLVARVGADHVRQIDAAGLGRMLRRSLHRMHHLEKLKEVTRK